MKSVNGWGYHRIYNRWRAKNEEAGTKNKADLRGQNKQERHNMKYNIDDRTVTNAIKKKQWTESNGKSLGTIHVGIYIINF